MKMVNFIIFFGIFFSLYALVNYYIYKRGLQSLSQNSKIKKYYKLLFLLFSLSFIIGRTLENFWLNPFSESLVWLGSFWLAAMLYFFLSLIIIDLFRLTNKIVPIFPQYVNNNYRRVKKYLGIGLISFVTILIIIGHINACIPEMKIINLHINKKANDIKNINIVVASDIHLGSIIGRERFETIVEKINSLNPDIVLFPGDIIDEDIAPVVKEDLGRSFKKIKTKYGVYASTGNHEYIGGVEKACNYLLNNGIYVIRDTIILVNNSVYLLGREDRSIDRFTNKKRKSLSEIMVGANDKGFPVILMDHQPFQLEEGSNNGIDLQLSGHTHYGQLWPLNYFANAIYELSWGYKKKGDTHIYVSSGVGTWGPPVRIGNRPEIVNIILTFN